MFGDSCCVALSATDFDFGVTKGPSVVGGWDILVTLPWGWVIFLSLVTNLCGDLVTIHVLNNYHGYYSHQGLYKEE
jgi:hypothetical protein